MIEIKSDCAINFGQLQRRERLLNALWRASVEELHDDGFEQDAALRYVIIALAKFNILFSCRLHNNTYSIIDIKMGESVEWLSINKRKKCLKCRKYVKYIFRTLSMEKISRIDRISPEI